MTDVAADPRAVDEKMHRLMGVATVELNRTKPVQAPGQRRVIGNRQVHLQQLDQATQKTFRLAQRKVEHHADR